MRKIKVLVSLCAVFLLLMSLGLVQGKDSQQSAKELYEAAVFKKDADGDMQGAIKLFQEIVERFSNNREMAAKAQLQIGMCHEKLGQKSVQLAKDAFQRVIDNYPSQSEEVRIAKEKLSRLIQIAEKELAEVSPKVMTDKKIWTDSDTDLSGAPSPDGKYLSYVDWDTGDLAIYEIATGKKRRLTNEGSLDGQNEYAEYSRWSPDNKHIVYVWMNKENFIELRIIGLDGSKPRILFKNKEVTWAELYDWSPDGKYIMARFTRGIANGQISLISVDDGSERILKSFDLRWPGGMKFSPDGRFIVYNLSKNKGSEDRDIFLMSVEGKREIPLIEHPANDWVLGWAPDGNNIIFGSDRTGSPDFWGIKVVNGKPQGIPTLIKSNKGPFSPAGLGFTTDGSFYYGNQVNKHDVYTIEIDPKTGKIIAAPSKIIKRFIGYNGTPDYSNDGQYLAYVSRRPAGIMRFTWNPVGNVLCIRSLETGEEKEIRPEINMFGFPRWSPDGSSVIVVGWNVNNKMGYYQINIQTGEASPIILTEIGNLFGGHDWSLDGNSLFYGLRDIKTRKYQIILRHINSGKEDVFYQTQVQFGLSLSPDGNFLAVLSYKEKSLKILPTSGGESRELIKSEEAKEFDFLPILTAKLCWSSDGEYIFFVKKDTDVDDSQWDLCRIAVENGEIEKLGSIMGGALDNLNAHPDGKHLSFSSPGKSRIEVWKMENFLPKIKENK